MFLTWELEYGHRKEGVEKRFSQRWHQVVVNYRSKTRQFNQQILSSFANFKMRWRHRTFYEILNFKLHKIVQEWVILFHISVAYAITDSGLFFKFTNWSIYNENYLYKIRVLGISNGNNSVNLLDQLLFLVIVEIHVPFG